MGDPACINRHNKANEREKGYPEPLVILPLTTHTFSIILLHGRGSNGPHFGLEFLKSRTSSGQTPQELFPSVKFIFPTAKKRRSTILKRVKINQWFDNYSLDDPTERQDLQYEGLTETTQFLHQLVNEEGTSLQGGVNNVIMGGLSQGCAMALIASMSFEANNHDSKQVVAPKDAIANGNSYRQSLGGFIGMSGWLPFADDILSAAIPNLPDGNDGYDDNDPFMRKSSDSLNKETRSRATEDSISVRQLRAANFVRDLVDLEPLQGRQNEQKIKMAERKEQTNNMPYFLGHGVVDEKVSLHLGTQIRDTLLQLGQDVTWKQYDDWGHWYKAPDELDDIANFLREKVGVTNTPRRARRPKLGSHNRNPGLRLPPLGQRGYVHLRYKLERPLRASATTSCTAPGTLYSSRTCPVKATRPHREVPRNLR